MNNSRRKIIRCMLLKREIETRDCFVFEIIVLKFRNIHAET